jgi:hypothetical protein
MTDRKLRLVKSPPESSSNEDAPAEADEALAAAALRDAIEAGDEPISSSLRAAYAPLPVADLDHDALLARALGDLDAPSTAAERRAAERLRLALDATTRAPLIVPTDAEEDAALLRALRVASSPATLDPLANEAILARALEDAILPASREEEREAVLLRDALASGKGLPTLVEALRAAERPRVIDPMRNEVLIAKALGRGRRRGLVPMVVGALAMAAAVALFATQGIRSMSSSDASSVATRSAVGGELIRSRSTAALFDAAEPFPRSGGESARIDRIASARAADLRANQFSAWGVR